MKRNPPQRVSLADAQINSKAISKLRKRPTALALLKDLRRKRKQLTNQWLYLREKRLIHIGVIFPKVIDAVFICRYAPELMSTFFSLRFARPPSLAAAQDIYRNSRKSKHSGRFLESSNNMKELRANFYLSVGADPLHTTPRFMDPIWASQFGHIGLLAMFAAAQDFNLVPKLRRKLLITKVGNKQLLDSLRHRFDMTRASFTPLKMSINDDRQMSLWHRVEGIELIRASQGGFFGTYELWENVWNHYEAASFSSPFKLSGDYFDQATSQLTRLGVPLDSPVVAFHLRDSRVSNDFRSATAVSYLEALKYLQNCGFTVIRIGSRSISPPLDGPPGVIDLPHRYFGELSLDPLVLQRSRFLMSTTSGPVAVAGMLGTPTLITNATAIATSALSGPSGNLILPKRALHRSKRVLRLDEMLKTPVAWAESLSQEEISLADNSPHDIREAAEEMIGQIIQNNPKRSSLQMKADEVRREHGAVSFGWLSNSFLDQYL